MVSRYIVLSSFDARRLFQADASRVMALERLRDDPIFEARPRVVLRVVNVCLSSGREKWSGTLLPCTQLADLKTHELEMTVFIYSFTHRGWVVVSNFSRKSGSRSLLSEYQGL